MSEKIYRFMSFSEAYNLLCRERLKITKMAAMSDQNEGIGQILENLVRHFIGTHSREKIIRAHKIALENNYLSCWTREPDNIAMWLLYSPSKQSIRVSTTIEKLQKITATEYERNSWGKHIHSQAGTFQLSKAWVEEVKYIDLRQNSISIQQRFKQYMEKLALTSESRNLFGSEDDFAQPSFSLTDGSPLAIKDHTYAHEKEIRAIFWGSIRSKVSYEESLIKSGTLPFLYSIDKASPDDLPSVKYIEVDDSMVDEICFDPRMPEYEKEVYMEVLGLNKDNPLVVTSDAFGYIPTDFSSFDFMD